jgi:Protein of unknown function (DUF2637)
MNALRRLADGVLPQAVITGSLSFAHIHDLAQKYGQTGWKAWTYPLSVDLLTVAAYRKMIEAHRAKRPVILPWLCFLLSLAASLAANVIATGGRNPLSIAVGVWPALAFLGCTLLGHPSDKSATTKSVEPVVDTFPVHPESVVVEQITAPQVAALAPALAPAVPGVAPALLDFARKLDADHRATHGTPITLDALRSRLGVSAPLVQTVHTYLTA